MHSTTSQVIAGGITLLGGALIFVVASLLFRKLQPSKGGQYKLLEIRWVIIIGICYWISAILLGVGGNALVNGAFSWNSVVLGNRVGIIFGGIGIGHLLFLRFLQKFVQKDKNG